MDTCLCRNLAVPIKSTLWRVMIFTLWSHGYLCIYHWNTQNQLNNMALKNCQLNMFSFSDICFIICPMMRRKPWSHWDTKSCMIYKKEWFIPLVFLWLQSCYKIYKDSILVSLVWGKCQLVYVLMDPCDSSKLITNF